MKVKAEASCPNRVYEDYLLSERKTATEVLKKTWKKIDELDRLLAETGRPDIAIQLEHLKKQCIEIMENVHEKEKHME